MSQYDSDEFDHFELLESEYSSIPSVRRRETKVICFDLDLCDSGKIIEGKKVQCKSANEQNLRRYASKHYPEKNLKIINCPTKLEFITGVTFITLSSTIDSSKNVFIIPDKTFDDETRAAAEYNHVRYDYHCLVLSRELSFGSHIRSILSDRKNEDMVAIFQILPKTTDQDHISFISYDEMKVCFLAYVIRKPILVKMSFHKSLFVKEKNYIKCYTSDSVGKVIQNFKISHPSHLRVKLSLKAKILKEHETMGSYTSHRQQMSTLDHYRYIRSGEVPLKRSNSLTVTVHLICETHIATILEKENSKRCIVYIDKNGSTQDMKSAIAKVLHRDSASFRVIIQDNVVPDVECLTDMSLLRENVVLRISDNPTISLSCTVSDENTKHSLTFNVYPNLSDMELRAKVSDALQMDSLLFDIYHGQKPIAEILSEKHLYKTDMIVIEVKRKRKKINYYVSTSLRTRNLQRKGCLVIDDLSEAKVVNILSLFGRSLNVDPVDLRIIESGRCLDQNNTIEELGISDSPTFIISLCPGLLQNEEFFKTKIIGNSEGLLQVSETLMIEGMPVLAHPSYPFERYKERLSKKSSEKRKIMEGSDLASTGLRFLDEKTLYSPKYKREEKSAIIVESHNIDLPSSQKSVPKHYKTMMLKRAHKAKSKITKSDGDYSDRDTNSESALSQDISTKRATKHIQHSKSETDIKEVKKRKGRVSFSDADTKENREHIPSVIPELESHGLQSCNPSIMCSSDEPETGDIQILQRVTRENVIMKQGKTVMERETYVRNKLLSSAEIREQGNGDLAVADKSANDAESTFYLNVAKEIGRDWKMVGRNLNIEESDFESIESKWADLHERCYQMLQTWKRRRGSHATKDVLVEALRDSNLVSVAELVRDFL